MSILYCLSGTDMQGTMVLVGMLYPSCSKTGTGTAVKCCPLLTQQPVLSPRPWAPRCLAHWCFPHTWAAAPRFLVTVQSPAGVAFGGRTGSAELLQSRLCEEVLPHVQTELHLLQFVPVAPCPVAGHQWRESGPVLLTPTLQIFISIYKVLSSLSCINPYKKVKGIWHEFHTQ